MGFSGARHGRGWLPPRVPASAGEPGGGSSAWSWVFFWRASRTGDAVATAFGTGGKADAAAFGGGLEIGQGVDRLALQMGDAAVGILEGRDGRAAQAAGQAAGRQHGTFFDSDINGKPWDAQANPVVVPGMPAGGATSVAAGASVTTSGVTVSGAVDAESRDGQGVGRRLALGDGLFSALNTRVGYSDYTHTEFEGAEVGTVFDTKGIEARAVLEQACRVVPRLTAVGWSCPWHALIRFCRLTQSPGWPGFSPVFATWPFQRPWPNISCTTHLIRPARSHAPSVAMWPRTAAVCAA